MNSGYEGLEGVRGSSTPPRVPGVASPPPHTHTPSLGPAGRGALRGGFSGPPSQGVRVRTGVDSQQLPGNVLAVAPIHCMLMDSPPVRRFYGAHLACVCGVQGRAGGRRGGGSGPTPHVHTHPAQKVARVGDAPTTRHAHGRHVASFLPEPHCKLTPGRLVETPRYAEDDCRVCSCSCG